MGPDGRMWSVRRQWFHRRPRWKEPERSTQKTDKGVVAEFGLEAASAASEAPAALIVVGALVVLALAWAFIFPALIFLADLVLIAVIAGVSVAVRVLFRRPWQIVAETKERPAQRFEVPVVGYRAGNAKIDEMLHEIRTSGTPVRP